MILACVLFVEKQRGKENQLSANSTIRTRAKKVPIAHTQLEKSLETQKLQVHILK